MYVHCAVNKFYFELFFGIRPIIFRRLDYYIGLYDPGQVIHQNNQRALSNNHALA
jgi:hypothetical protein